MEIEGYLDGIAERLRGWRIESGLTLQEVALRSSVAASTVQKVESQSMVPTVAVLIKIARGLGRSPVDLFEDCTTAAQVIHRRAAEEDAGANGNHGPHQLTGQLSAPQLSLWRVVHAPGEGTEARHLAPRGEGVIFCEEGLLEVTSGKQVFSLEPGDSLHSKTREGLSWRAAGDASSRFVLIGTSVLGLDQVLAGSGFSRVASSSVPA